MRRTKPNKFWQFLLLTAIYHSVLATPVNAAGTEPPLIFPFPQEMRVTHDNFTVDETVSIIIPMSAGESDVSLARSLVHEFSDKYGTPLKIEASPVIPNDRKAVVMGTLNNPLIKKYCQDNNLELTEKSPGPEGYILHVSNKLIVVVGWDQAGAFYGMQSLRQLIMNGNGKEIRGVEVRDWPAFPFRAIRMFPPGPENMAFFKRFVKDFMALYKYNHVVLEFSTMRLDKHPEVNVGWIEFAKYMQYTRLNEPLGLLGETKNATHYDGGDGVTMEKDDVRDIVSFARQNFLEVVPELPSLTHSYYLLARHPELAEYPGDHWPDTYCPSNPGSYELLFDIYDEYIEATNPKMVHIGHDEWWGAPMDVCPHCKGKDYSTLFAQDINKIHSYLAGKGIKVAMWGDFLLESVRGEGPNEMVSHLGVKYRSPGGLRPSTVRDSIPKDILLFNWFWRNNVDDIRGQDKEIELQELGFEQVFGNFTPDITNWGERTEKLGRGFLGGAPSAWSATNEAVFGKDLVAEFLGCANLLWSSREIGNESLPTIVATQLPYIRRAFKGEWVPSEKEGPVVPIDIFSHFNLAADTDVFNINLSTLLTGEVTSRSKIFNLGDPKLTGGNCAIAVGTEGPEKNPLPLKAISIPVNEDVSSLVFLHACALPAGNLKTYYNVPNSFDTSDLLGWYEVVYEDGYKEVIPIRYGVNILEWRSLPEKNKIVSEHWEAQNIYAYEADLVNCSSDPENRPVNFFAYEWVNKRMGKKIKEVNMHSSVNYQALTNVYRKPVTEPMQNNAIMLLGISKVEKRVPYIDR